MRIPDEPIDQLPANYAFRRWKWLTDPPIDLADILGAVDEASQRELIALNLETIAEIHQVIAVATGKAAEIVKGAQTD